jgi:GWxTD domain-containing protein
MTARRLGPPGLRGSIALAIVALLAVACASGPRPSRDVADLTNPFLGPELSQWLVGPITGIATREEVQAYLALRDDASAQRFIDAFWQKRDARPAVPGNPARELFEQRCAEADHLYSEAGYSGRRTDRGTLYVLFGPPDKVDREINPQPYGPPIEVWIYDPKAPRASLTGRPPGQRYRFVKRADFTQFYTPVS